MTMLGVDTNSLLVYEGASIWGHAVWPPPAVTGAALVISTEEQLKGVDTRDLLTVPLIFREDAFDPVSRVRRGRFYSRNEAQPIMWQLHPHPALGGEERKVNSHGVIPKNLATFHSCPISQKILSNTEGQPLIVLGNADRFTVWTIVGIEMSLTGEEVVTLRSRASVGALPVIDHGRIPASGRDSVFGVVSKLAEDIYRAGPEAIIHVARDVACVILSTYLQDKGLAKSGLELGELIKKLEGQGGEDKKDVVVSAAKLVARLHARAKPVEQERRPLRPIREQDAELTVQCIGTILCDLGWADWK